MNAPLDADLARALRCVTLDDKYALEQGRAFMNGNQALVRLPMLQRERDRIAGLRTAGFISGYRGSPLGALDQALWKAREHLDRQQIVFRPGVNEELAANALWGTQQIGLFPGAKADGVFGLWYGKGPGVDRCSDVFKHANAAGSATHGGVIAVAGDDHGAKSSTLPHQSEFIFKACGMPVFYPAGVQEFLDFGLHGWAMSRWSGLWVAMKAVTDVAESSAAVVIDPDHITIQLPSSEEMPHGGLNIRWPDSPMAQEQRLLDFKGDAALAYIRANRLNFTAIDSPSPWLGLVAGGKSYLDTRQALDDLGLDATTCSAVGIRLFKVGVVWPLEPSSLRAFATGLREIFVIEEKRSLVESAVKEALYDWRDDLRPQIYGKLDPNVRAGDEVGANIRRDWLLAPHGEHSPAMVARAIGRRLISAGHERRSLSPDILARIQARLAILEAKERKPILLRVESLESVEPAQAVELQRTPTFCSGCPHNTSTHVPEGSRALAGIGCHFMAQWDPARRTDTFSQMGGEGAAWIGQAPFCETPHVFANMGDGTYFHSGVLAIRAAVAARATITYKLLYNDAVAMTGGQPLDGSLTVPQVVAQLRAEGVHEVVIVTDEPEKYQRGAGTTGATRFPPSSGPNADAMMAHALDDVRVEHRDHLDAVQRRLREVAGVTVIVYDQTCASEKRRRRKRKGPDGQPGFPDPARRVVINEAVCEGCGDCTVQSSCVSVEPLETPLGRKRKINQSSCNKDFSCLKGFCPSFVTVEGGKWRGRAQVQAQVGVQSRASVTNSSSEWPELPEPMVATVNSLASSGVLARPYSILVTGVGGTGVVTIGQLLGMAAHLDGRGVAVLDMAGLAQKGGAVTSHIQIAQTQDQLFATRVAIGEAQLVIGGDLVVTCGADALARMRSGVTRVILNADVAPTVEALRNPDWRLPEARLRAELLATVGSESVDWVSAQRLAVALCGDALYANPFMLGWACQRGWLPVTQAALERAIELNGAAVSANLAAFLWGRRAAHDFAAVASAAFGAPQVHSADPAVQSLDSMIELRSRHLTDYQNSALAQRYKDLIARVQQAELRVLGAKAHEAEGLNLTEAVAQQYFRLLSYKDEYEIARLYSDPAFLERLRTEFEGDWSLRFHLAPPGLARVDPLTGRPRKIAFGPWMLPVFRGLARLKFLRGTVFDPFGMTEERRQERLLIVEYEALIEELILGLSPQTRTLAVKLARIPEHIRGFGLVKEANWQRVRGDWRDLLAQWRVGNRLQSAP
jgi:indolepyruvate ferredoxin oxidoreductase